jgi:anti-anti-sigma factor
MANGVTSVEREGRTAVVRVHGDLVIPTIQRLHGTLRGLQRRRDVKKVVLDFSAVGRLDSAGVAVVELARRALKRSGKELQLDKLGESQRAAFELAPPPGKQPPPPERPTWLEDIGDRVVQFGQGVRDVA